MCGPDPEMPINRHRSAQLRNRLSSEAGFELADQEQKVSEMREMIGSGKNGNLLPSGLALCHNVI
jgi:hypothetical protein